MADQPVRTTADRRPAGCSGRACGETAPRPGAARPPGADLSGASLINADLSGAALLGADLPDATLAGANLSDTQLSREGGRLHGADPDSLDLDRPANGGRRRGAGHAHLPRCRQSPWLLPQALGCARA
ncbi:pentapeptide repeat-containing protein, partial [Streptomyces sp. NPDC002785]|uniref:pentapeptide repeat-containing protein n=1 Tax=Streptomyces sp. NPDC002785 TaxID=3154543 RepID=UPI00331C2271